MMPMITSIKANNSLYVTNCIRIIPPDEGERVVTAYRLCSIPCGLMKPEELYHKKQIYVNDRNLTNIFDALDIYALQC